MDEVVDQATWKGEITLLGFLFNGEEKNSID